jgi:membrane-associated phospholipid phosphatase
MPGARRQRGVRSALCVTLFAAVALPIARRRLRLRGGTVLAGASLAPLCAALLAPRSRARDALVCALQMYVYVAAYKMPNDDPGRLESRVRVDYPVRLDRILGAGALPTIRLQRALHRGEHFRGFEKVLVWAHWVWFATPHAAIAYILARNPRRFPRAALMTYAVFDVGVLTYWVLPTAPPWYAAARGRLGSDSNGGAIPVRRLMVEYGESFWQDGWGPLYSVFGGNPLAAMPSLHFATSAMAGTLLAETGPLAGAVGTAYAGVLGFSLVYLGEHYVVDLLGGLALMLAVRAGERHLREPLSRVGELLVRIERLAALPPPEPAA